MAKSVLIVEKDVALMSNVRDALAAKGFGVESTTDGRAAPELIRKIRPDLVVLAVDLDAGQNGYILCRKLKNDDDLKAVPVIIIGDPRGFAKHQSLATRADDYVGKPFECEALVDRVGGLLGFDGSAADEGSGAVSLSDEGAIALADSGQLGEDGDVELMDSNAAEASSGDLSFDEEPLREEIPLGSGFDVDEPGPAEKTVTGFVPLTHADERKPPAEPAKAPSPSRPERDARAKAAAPPPHGSAPTAAPAAAHVDQHELRELKAKVAELTASLADATQRSTELEGRARELESALESATAVAEAAKSSAASGGKADKEVITLKENLTKKDRELLRLRTDLNARDKELNEKEQVVIELHEKENALEQRLSEANEQLATRDGQLKASTAKAEQLATDKRKLEQQLGTNRDELRATAAKLTTLEAEHEQLQGRLGELERELDATRTAKADLETAKDQLQTSLNDAKGELDALRARHDDRGRELDDARSQLDQASRDLEEARGQVGEANRELDSTRDALQRAIDEREEARQRVGELEGELKAEKERVHRSSTRARNQHAAMERARKALEQAVHDLQDGAASVHD